MPITSVATTGTPKADDSIKALGFPSLYDVSTDKSDSNISFIISFLSKDPTKLIYLLIFRFSAIFLNLFSSLPSPYKFNSKFL